MTDLEREYSGRVWPNPRNKKRNRFIAEYWPYRRYQGHQMKLFPTRKAAWDWIATKAEQEKKDD